MKHENVKNKYAQLYLALHNESDFLWSGEEEEDRMAVIERVMKTCHLALSLSWNSVTMKTRNMRKWEKFLDSVVTESEKTS